MDLHQVTLTQMRYAVAVDELRSFGLAAQQCKVSQSGLSMQIHKLEDLLATVLFDRSKKPVLVTPEGAAAIAQMRKILRETERLGQVASDQEAPAGPFRLGVIPTLSSSVIPLFLRRFVELYPKVQLSIEEIQTEEIIARLQADTLDAGIAATPLGVAELHEDIVGREALLAYLPENDPLLRKKSLAQLDLEDRELWIMPEGHCFRSQVLSYCGAKRASSPGHVRFESGNFETLIRLVDEGLGTTVLPALIVQRLSRKRQAARVRALTGPTPVREIGLVRSRLDYRRAVGNALAESLRAGLASALGPTPRRSENGSELDLRFRLTRCSGWRLNTRRRMASGALRSVGRGRRRAQFWELAGQDRRSVHDALFREPVLSARAQRLTFLVRQ
jgi:LysR family hydrogen peroxide-inducible transcriptional activator